MSLRTLPLLFINLGGEMMYILDQRLRAQNIPSDKSRKVLHDIVGAMLNKRFVEELFKPQDLYTKKAMRTVFDRLAHASIMRLNSASMDKLYDLMTMAFKHQLSLSLRPQDILLVTLNHLDAIRMYVEDVPVIRNQVETVHQMLYKVYASMSPGELQLLRQTLLTFFQDTHIRVSIFLKDKVQNSNGRFVLPINGKLPFGVEIPGTIRYHDGSDKPIQTSKFHMKQNYTVNKTEGTYQLKGNRVTKLGTNMYSIVRPSETNVSHTKPMEHVKPVSEERASANINPLVKAELNLLAHLMGSVDIQSSSKKDTAIKLSLFNTDEEEQQFKETRPPTEMYDWNVIKIDASKNKTRDELNKIMGDLDIGGSTSLSNKGDDLLELMDSC
ncbi:protein OSCP1-like [Anneissia japonica]|uniref:protein OSCP1-like n=1 Tax=Anneissia japonica TaxID=1529436 RepID=UPI0014259483|nr:protein OSCP1-like [Anneissia japonica]